VTSDIYAQRVNAVGVPEWTTDGVLVSSTNNHLVLVVQNPTIVSDGAGGAIITWFDFRTDAPDIYAERLNAAGVAQWTENGVAVCTAADHQLLPEIASDGAGGAIITWHDYRTSHSVDIYAQNITAAGVLGGTILSVPPKSVASL